MIHANNKPITVKYRRRSPWFSHNIKMLPALTVWAWCGK